MALPWPHLCSFHLIIRSGLIICNTMRNLRSWHPAALSNHLHGNEQLIPAVTLLSILCLRKTTFAFLWPMYADCLFPSQAFQMYPSQTSPAIRADACLAINTPLPISSIAPPSNGDETCGRLYLSRLNGLISCHLQYFPVKGGREEGYHKNLSWQAACLSLRIDSTLR